ncbi:MAG: hypothetical protein COT73_05330 [Bdellovibrio sp. CG10_big_fil_rev_8_21_14_0_10_47_8]|nr:MAG: hypothetical protein COT73_05330 [Bdellovibrio sp. CG10_big_fil_rev_8_21_14_0_10_47_8]
MMTIDLTSENWILMGASRGFGRAFLQRVLSLSSKPRLLVIARKATSLGELGVGVRTLNWDFADRTRWADLAQLIGQEKPTRLFYFAGGGPFGNFSEKKWTAHEWAMDVTFHCPSFLLHHLMADKDLRQITMIGSAVAESSSDEGAASYCAAKHALKGLVTSLQVELKKADSPLDLRLFSPGYMDTDLLPKNAWPRQRAGLVKDPAEQALQLSNWILNPDDAGGHWLVEKTSLLK